LRRSKEEKLTINGVEGFKSNQRLTMEARHTHKLQQTTADNEGQRKREKEFTPPLPDPTDDEIVEYLKHLLGKEFKTPYANFRYRVLPEGEWIHVHGPLISPCSEWIDDEELAPDQAVRETSESYSGRR
jgi:hypothetical protein